MQYRRQMAIRQDVKLAHAAIWEAIRCLACLALIWLIMAAMVGML